MQGSAFHQFPEAPSLLLAVAEHQQTCGAAMSCDEPQKYTTSDSSDSDFNE